MNHRVRLRYTLAALAVAGRLAAQSAPAPSAAASDPKPVEPDAVVTLSPFEVATSKDTGYQATETLAGTRIRTDLRDVGSAIQVLTKEFLRDLGATDSSTLLEFTTSTEVAGTHSTFANVTPSAGGVDESANLRAPAGAQRVRGLAAADNSRDFFVTDIPWDSYMADRIEIQRGPNSILFGLGSPAGMINANRPRTITPNDDISAWFRSNVVSASNPFGGMNKLVANNPYDPWRTDNVVAGNGYGITQSGTVNYNPYVSVPPNAQQPFWLIDGATNQLYRVEGGYIGGGRNSDATGTLRSVSQGLVGRRTNDNFYGINGLNGAAVGLGLPGAQFGQYKQQSMLDPSIFDYNNILIDGNNKHEYEKWTAYNIDLQQSFLRDRVAFDFSYDRQKYRNGQDRFFGGSPTVTMDILKNFSDFYVNGSDGLTTTNPNFGRPYIFGGGNTAGGNSYRSDRKYTRASIFGEVRASDLTKNEFLIKLFGKQRFNGNFADEKYGTENLGWQDFANSQAWAAYWNGTDGSGSTLSDRPPQAFVYLGSSIAGLSSASGAHIPGVSTNVTMPDSGVHVFDPTWTGAGLPTGGTFTTNWNVPTSLYKVFGGLPNPDNTNQLTQASNPANYVGWNSNFQDRLLRYNGGQDKSLINRAALSLRETKSFAGSWQGYMWRDAIIPTLGWRYDEVKSEAYQAQPMVNNRGILNLQPDVYKLPDTFPANAIFKDHSTSGGVVAHLNRFFEKDRLPINVSFQYNKSNNFQVTDARRDLYGNTIANPTGKTKDLGITLSTKDNRFSIRVVKFDTAIKNASSGLSTGALGSTIQQGLRWRNVFLYKLGAYDWATREQPQNRNTWGGSTAQGDAVNGADTSITSAQGRALEDAAIKTWNNIQAHFDALGFFKAWGFTPTTLSALTDRTTYQANPAAYQPDPSTVYAYAAQAPANFTITSDTQSKGYEFEVVANPTRNWRIAFNASKTEAFRTNVGGKQLDDYVSFLDSQFLNPDGSLTAAARMPQFGNLSGFGLFNNVYSPWKGNYIAVKANENASVPEIRKWRFNIVTNYSFREGSLKGFGVGGTYNWIDKVGIGYPFTATGLPILSRPYYGPSESTIGLFASYEHKLTAKIGWRIQLNVRNAFSKDGLIPVSVEPDGQTWASVRTKPNQEWLVTNTFSF
jgi:outer membrane receptor protein involved in Fe transport